MSALVPVPRLPMTIRPATMGDLSFIDQLQKMHSKRVGWMPAKQLEGKIGAGQVMVAESVKHEDMKHEEQSPSSCFMSSCFTAPLGYCIGHDQYFKRDDVGIIYQMNVVPDRQRGLIGASLVKAMFERAAYGCRLFCCWCAQDIEANYFWESLGFIPLAFRSGSRGKRRIHIFWQRRIREGDTTTPYWFPAQTSAGSIREDRLVLPIPPGTCWRDVMPVVLPGEKSGLGILPEPKKKRSGETPKPRIQATGLGKLSFASPNPVKEKPVKAPRQKLKNDPRHVAAARELRDRYLEQFNQGMLLPQEGQGGQGQGGKYAVARALTPSPSAVPRALLPAA